MHKLFTSPHSIALCAHVFLLFISLFFHSLLFSLVGHLTCSSIVQLSIHLFQHLNHQSSNRSSFIFSCLPTKSRFLKPSSSNSCPCNVVTGLSSLHTTRLRNFDNRRRQRTLSILLPLLLLMASRTVAQQSYSYAHRFFAASTVINRTLYLAAGATTTGEHLAHRPTFSHSSFRNPSQPRVRLGKHSPKSSAIRQRPKWRPRPISST